MKKMNIQILYGIVLVFSAFYIIFNNSDIMNIEGLQTTAEKSGTSNFMYLLFFIVSIFILGFLRIFVKLDGNYSIANINNYFTLNYFFVIIIKVISAIFLLALILGSSIFLPGIWAYLRILFYIILSICVLFYKGIIKIIDYFYHGYFADIDFPTLDILTYIAEIPHVLFQIIHFIKIPLIGPSVDILSNESHKIGFLYFSQALIFILTMGLYLGNNNDNIKTTIKYEYPTIPILLIIINSLYCLLIIYSLRLLYHKFIIRKLLFIGGLLVLGLNITSIVLESLMIPKFPGLFYAANS